MTINKKDPDRLSRFVWTGPDDIVIIKAGDEEAPKSDTEPGKPAPGDVAPAAAPEDVIIDPEQKDKP